MRLRKALVASQVAVSLLLLIGAGLFIRTLDNLLAVDVGFDTTRLIEFSIDPSLNGYTPQRTKQFSTRLLERLNSTPGIDSAGFASVRLLEGNRWSSTMTVQSYDRGPDENMSHLCNSISPGYFDTMGIPLILGRDFTDRDELVDSTLGEGDIPPYLTAIANQRFVQQYFGDQNPIGRRIGFGGNPGTPTPIEIVGVVGDAKYTDVRDETQRQLFFPYLENFAPGAFTVYARASRPPDAVYAVVRRAVQELDPALPVYGTRTLERQVERSLRRERMVATMTIVFGTLATVLAVVGLYGVMSYTVARRTREIGIRMALGARASAIGWLVIREVLMLAAVEGIAGLVAAWWLTRFVSSQLYGVEPTDPMSIAAALIVLAVVAVLAGLLPSTRAAQIDPMTALRYE